MQNRPGPYNHPRVHAAPRSFLGQSGGARVDALRLSAGHRRVGQAAAVAGGKGGHPALGVADRAGARRGGGDPGQARQHPGPRLSGASSSSSWSPRTPPPTVRTRSWPATPTAGVRLIECPRGGKVAAQDRAVARPRGEIVAFGDANVLWEPDALREHGAAVRRPRGGMACGYVRLVNPAGGTNQEGVYWRYEMWLRAQESARALDHRLKRRHLRRPPGPPTARSIRVSGTTCRSPT